MKTKTENRIQDLVSQDACPGTRVKATLAFPAQTDLSDLSETSDGSDSPSFDETLINSLFLTAPVRSHGLIYSRSHARPIDVPFARRHTSYLSRSTAEYSRTHWNAFSRVITGCHAFARIKNWQPKPFKPAPSFSPKGRRRGHETLISSGSRLGQYSSAKRLDNHQSPIRNQQSGARSRPLRSPALVTLYASLITLPHAIRVPSIYNEIPSARFALFIDLSRYSTINNAYSRNSENAAPIAQYNEMAPASSFPPLPLLAPVGNPPVRLKPQASSHLKQGDARPGKVTQGSSKNSSASLASKASLLRPVAIRQPLAPSGNIGKLQSGNVWKNQETPALQNHLSQEMSGFVRKYQVIPHSALTVRQYQEISSPRRIERAPEFQINYRSILDLYFPAPKRLDSPQFPIRDQQSRAVSHSVAKSSRTDWNALSRIITGCHAFEQIKNLEPKPFKPAPELTQIKSQSTPPCRSLLPLFPSVISDRRPRTSDFRRYPQASKRLRQAPASLACKTSFLCPMPTPQSFARKRLASSRFVARNCALSLIIARYGGIPWHFLPSRCDGSRTACPRRPNRNTHFYTGLHTFTHFAQDSFSNNHQIRKSAIRSSPFLYFQTPEMIKTGGLRNELRTPIET
jgi:hypothetical protein